MRDTTLASDTVRAVALILFLLGLVGLVTGAVISYQQPPSPLALPTLVGSSIATLIGTALVILIVMGVVGE